MSKSHRNGFDHAIGLPITVRKRSERADIALVGLSDKADKQSLLSATLLIVIVKNDQN